MTTWKDITSWFRRWKRVLLIALIIALVLLLAFSLIQVIFIFLIIAICALFLYSSFVNFVNTYIVSIGSFLNNKIIYDLNNIIRAARKTEVIGKFVKQFLNKIPPLKITCFKEPFGYQMLGFKKNKGCEKLLIDKKKLEKQSEDEEKEIKKEVKKANKKDNKKK